MQGEELILQTYCPDQLPAFREHVQGLKFANVILTSANATLSAPGNGIGPLPPMA